MSIAHSIDVFPSISTIEEIDVLGFPNTESLFQRIIYEARRPGKSFITFLNINSANLSWQDSRFKKVLQSADVVYCDGAGVVWGSHILGNPLPKRLTAADWFLDMVDSLSAAGVSLYLLGGEPGIAERTLEIIEKRNPNHTVIGHYHGFFKDDPQQESLVLSSINKVKPDVLIVGLGTPIQEYWIEEMLPSLDVSTIYAIGATMDFVAEKVPRCPNWVGKSGFEWLYRFFYEPRRMFQRYIVGNPFFIGRACIQALKDKLQLYPSPLPKSK